MWTQTTRSAWQILRQEKWIHANGSQLSNLEVTGLNSTLETVLRSHCLEANMGQRLAQHTQLGLRYILTNDNEGSQFNFTFMCSCIVTNFFVIKQSRCTNFPNLIQMNQLDATMIYWSIRSAQHVSGNILPIFRSVRLRFFTAYGILLLWWPGRRWAAASQIYSSIKLLMFGAVPLPIIRSLFTVHSVLVYVIQVCRQLSSRTRMELQFHPGPARQMSTNMYGIYHCWVYSE